MCYIKTTSCQMAGPEYWWIWNQVFEGFAKHSFKIVVNKKVPTGDHRIAKETNLWHEVKFVQAKRIVPLIKIFLAGREKLFWIHEKCVWKGLQFSALVMKLHSWIFHGGWSSWGEWSEPCKKPLHLGFSCCFIFKYTIVFYEPIQKNWGRFSWKFIFWLISCALLVFRSGIGNRKVTALFLRKLMAEPDNA
jgi:hypothetical protein